MSEHLEAYQRVKELIAEQEGIAGLLVVLRGFAWSNAPAIREVLSGEGFQELFAAPDGGSDGPIIEALNFEETGLAVDIDALILKLFQLNGRSFKIVVKQLCPIQTDTYGGIGE